MKVGAMDTLNVVEYLPGGVVRSGCDGIAKGTRVAPGERVAVVLPNGRELACVLVYLYQRGAVAVPVSPALAPGRIDFICEHAQVAAVVRRVDDRIQWERRSVEAPPSPEDDRFLIYTSGSTGMPKGVVLTRQAVEHNARAVASLHGFGPGRPHATCLPLYHCNALMMSLLGSLLAGGKLVLCPIFQPALFFEAMAREGVVTGSLVPALLQRVVDACPAWPPDLQYLVTAAAPLSSTLAGRFHALYGNRLRQGYGLTEAVNFSFVMDLLPEEEFRREYLDRKPPVGRPLPDTEYRLQAGEVQVRGPNLMRGYWRNPEATAEAIISGGWLRTGDLGEMRGGNLVLKGRSKEVINRGGESHYPAALEDDLTAAGMPTPFAVFAVDNERLGDDVGVICESRESVVILDCLKAAGTRPGAVETGPLLVTSTGKPRRRDMGRLLFSVNESPENVMELMAALGPGREPGNKEGRTPVQDRSETLHWPLREFRRMVGEYLRRRLAGRRLVVADSEGVGWIWPSPGDIPAEVEAAEVCGDEARLSGFLGGLADGALGAVIGVNVFRQAPSLEPVLREAVRVLAPGGTLLLSECEPGLNSAAPNPVDAMLLGEGLAFGPSLTRKVWLKAFVTAGFGDWGFSVFRAGKYDLGGLLWAHKPSE
jgi:long-chain acyl-CoA synthetase